MSHKMQALFGVYEHYATNIYRMNCCDKYKIQRIMNDKNINARKNTLLGSVGLIGTSSYSKQELRSRSTLVTLTSKCCNVKFGQ